MPGMLSPSDEKDTVVSDLLYARGPSIRAGCSYKRARGCASVLLKAVLTVGVIMFVTIGGWSGVYHFGPENIKSAATGPAKYNTLSSWRQQCLPRRGSTAIHYAYRERPKTPALTFPSWAVYEPISELGPDDLAWLYPARHTLQSNKTIDVAPVGVFVGLLCRPNDRNRREMIRRAYQSARWGGYNSSSLDSVTFKFFVGLPRTSIEAAELQDEMTAYDDILILPVTENLNRGKTFAFFEWAARKAKVPDCDFTSRKSKWVAECAGEREPDYVIKADMDTFLVLPAVEQRLRMLPRTKLYWGRMIHGHGGLKVKGDFMVGAGYGLSFDMVRYIAQSAFLPGPISAGRKTSAVVWVTEDCWMYDHPRMALEWAHGFLFPDTVAAIQRGDTADLTPAWIPDNAVERWLTTTPSGKSYSPVSLNLTRWQSAESLVESSPLSLLHPHNLQQPLSPAELETRIAEAFARKRRFAERMIGWEAGSTLWVHYAKADELWYDAEMAFLDH